jgi:phosphoribosylaminoimidazole-succinocarboxamide synthase
LAPKGTVNSRDADEAPAVSGIHRPLTDFPAVDSPARGTDNAGLTSGTNKLGEGRTITTPALQQTDLRIEGVTLVQRGKVRDVYAVADRVLLVATDRLSAFDCVLPTPIPHKGSVLTQTSKFWFEMLGGMVENHMLATDVDAYPEALRAERSQLEGRSMLCRRADVVPVECVVRGYLIGSGWKDYLASGEVCGVRLPEGLRMADRLPEPIFTPSTKAERGEHDENVSESRVADMVGRELAEWLRDTSIAIYTRAAAYALERGIIIADTKFEFGLVDGRPILVDECLTPDSSRFWPAADYVPGSSPASFDKQFVRDYLESLGWDKRPPAPPLPDDVARRTSEKYLEAYRLLTGQDLAP